MNIGKWYRKCKSLNSNFGLNGHFDFVFLVSITNDDVHCDDNTFRTFLTTGKNYSVSTSSV